MLYRYEAIFEYVENHTDAFVSEMTRSAKKYNIKFLLISPLVLLIELLSSRRKVEVLFCDDRFDHLIGLVSKKTDVGLLYGFCSLKVLVKIIKEGYPCCIVWRERFLLNRAFLSGCDKRRRFLVEKAIGLIEKRIVRLDPKVLVLWGDSLFLHRAIVCAARKAGIPTVVLQHGVIMEGIPLKYLDGSFGDYYFTWSESVKKYYIQNKLRDEDTMKIMGYQFSHYNAGTCDTHAIENRRVCILGQGLYDYYEEYKNIYFDVLHKIFNSCRDLNLEVMYRPHPGEVLERIGKVIPEWVSISRKESIHEVFNTYDVFIGFNSTALIEATINGKVSVQIRDGAWAFKDFESFGYAYTIENSEDEIKSFLLKYIQQQISPVCIKEEYLMLPSDIEERFLKCLDSIGVKITRKQLEA